MSICRYKISIVLYDSAMVDIVKYYFSSPCDDIMTNFRIQLLYTLALILRLHYKVDMITKLRLLV